MEEKKLTDEEIVKALEMDCLRAIYSCDCEECPLFDKACSKSLPKAIKELIHRLQSENKTLKTELCKECEEHKQFVELAKKVDTEQKAEIERLTERLDYFQKSSDYHEGNQKELEAKNAELQKQVDELKKSQVKHIHIDEQFKKECEYEIQQAVKDAAKEILDELLDMEVKDEDYKMFFLDVCEKLEKFAEKYGVEVE